MQTNRNGIPVQIKTSKKNRQRKPLNNNSGERSFKSMVNGVEVLAVLRDFSLIDMLENDRLNWREVK